jgi:hypothetical protein
MNSITLNLNIVIGQHDNIPLQPQPLTIATPLPTTNHIQPTIQPIISSFEIPLCKPVSSPIHITRNVFVDNKQLIDKTFQPEIISNERVFKETTNPLRVKKGFKGTRHIHQTNDDGFKTCPYCDYNTVNANTLSMHINNNHPEQSGRIISPHICTYCNKGFQASTKLAHHIKNHHEITFHKCPFVNCSYQNAKNTTTLATHIASKHLKHCYHEHTCLNCNIRVGSSIKYHVAFCSPLSPLFRHTY